MNVCKILMAAFACLLISACEKAPTSISKADFPSTGLSFEIRTREAGASVANAHEIYAMPMSTMQNNEILIFDGIGGDTPKILHNGGNRFTISYVGALRYEVWAEKQVSLRDDSGRDRTRILFFEVNQ